MKIISWRSARSRETCMKKRRLCFERHGVNAERMLVAQASDRQTTDGAQHFNVCALFSAFCSYAACCAAAALISMVLALTGCGVEQSAAAAAPMHSRPLLATETVLSPQPATSAAPVRNFAGPLTLRDSLTFYVVNDSGRPFTLKLRYHDPLQARMDRPMLVRVFDPEEHLMVRHDVPGERVAGEAPTHEIQLPIAANQPGVYQVAITSFHASLDFDTEPALPWGVYGSPELIGRGDQFAEAHIYLPPRLDRLAISCEGALDSLTLTDEAGASRMTLRGTKASGQTALPIEGEHVWRLSVRAKGEYRLQFGGMPIILCPDAYTARAIRGSIDVLDDGTICFHKFQVRAQQILKRYRAMGEAAFAVDVPNITAYKDQWVRDPVRHRLLWGAYGVYAALPAVLYEQNLDPSSPWFGTIHAWRDANGNARRDNPWASYTRAALTRPAETVGTLAAVYSINEPFNPLYRHPGLRSRIIIASLQELMMLREHELPHAHITTFYGGERAFVFSHFTRSFPLVVNDCPEDVREVWTEGLARYVARQSITQVASTVNQWTVLMQGFQHFADGVGDAWATEVLKRHVRWLLTRNQWNLGRSDAGYFHEAEGPDATYTGISAHSLGYILKQTRDPELREMLSEALRDCFELFNHTIAPEPDGTYLGASSFCYRTPGDWTYPQHGGGVGMLADVFPQAAVHVGRVWLTAPPARTPVQASEAAVSMRQSLRYLDALTAFSDPNVGTGRIAGGPEIPFAIWQHYADVPLPGALPMIEQNRFTKNFGDEFLCVRRPSYYAFLYAAQNMGEWRRDQRPRDPRQQFMHNAGGLCMFWSPRFGSSILGKNWSAYAAHCLIAEHVSGNGADWEDYWSVSRAFDVQQSQATISGTLRDQPLAFTKQYRFLEDRIECDLTLRASGAADFAAMWECFPYPLEKPEPIRVVLLDEQGRRVESGPASAVAFYANIHEVHVIVFDQPRLCEFGADHATDNYKTQRRYGRVLAGLPAHWRNGEQQTFRWALLATAATDVPATVTRVAARMREAGK